MVYEPMDARSVGETLIVVTGGETAELVKKENMAPIVAWS